MSQEIIFNSLEEYEEFMQEWNSQPPGERAEVHIEERIVLKKFDGDLSAEQMELAEPVEVVDIVNNIVNGELVDSTRREVKNNGSD
jgi:hypothetical protein